MRIAIDLLWVKPQKSGGIESYIRNLLDGLMEIDDNNQYVLLVSQDNKMTFEKYYKNFRFKELVCNIKSNSVIKRIIWQNIFLDKLLIKNNIDLCFEPIYSKPLFSNKHIKYITTIHDLQALHYPQYFSILKRQWLKFSWKKSIETSNKVVAISNFVKNDILDKYSISADKIVTIYNPICLEEDIENFELLSKQYQIQENEYYYTVGQLLPHKNIITLIELIKKINDEKINIPKKLIITGINGKSKNQLIELIDKYQLTDKVILTGYITNSTRNSLYKNCKAFLFPSLFEGFGMPPIEAMLLGVKVICGKNTSIYEVTKGKAIYVDNPLNIEDWIEKLKSVDYIELDNLDKYEYDKINIAKKYLENFYILSGEKNEKIS